MNTESLTLLNDSEINYTFQTLEQLESLALGEELFIANSALSELYCRDQILAENIAWQILENFYGDVYLQATALEIAFECNQNKTIFFIRQHFDKFDDYLRNTVQELITENNLDNYDLFKNLSLAILN
jgi:hypothetical protein